MEVMLRVVRMPEMYIEIVCTRCREVVSCVKDGDKIAVEATSWGGVEWDESDGFMHEHECSEKED